MGILAIIPTIIQVLGGLGSAFAPGSDDKIQKIVSLVSHALGGITYAVSAIEQIKDRLGGAPITADDYDELIAVIDSNSATIQQLNQAAIDRANKP